MQTILQAPSFLAFIILVRDKTKTDEPQATRLEEICKSLECRWSMQKFINIGSRRESRHVIWPPIKQHILAHVTGVD